MTLEKYDLLYKRCACAMLAGSRWGIMAGVWNRTRQEPIHCTSMLSAPAHGPHCENCKEIWTCTIQGADHCTDMRTMFIMPNAV